MICARMPRLEYTLVTDVNSYSAWEDEFMANQCRRVHSGVMARASRRGRETASCRLLEYIIRLLHFTAILNKMWVTCRIYVVLGGMSMRTLNPA